MALVKQLGEGGCMCSLLPCALVFVKQFFVVVFIVPVHSFFCISLFFSFSLIWYE